MNVTELARRLKMNTKELLEKLPSLGFDIGKRAIKVDDLLVDKIVMAVEEDRRRRRIESREKKVKEIRLDDGKETTAQKQSKEVSLPATLSVKDFAEKMNLPINKVIGELMKNGIMSSMNERIDFETASIIAEDLGYKALLATEAEAVSQSVISGKNRIKQEEEAGNSQNTETRPPVVIVMGHVDHGKTKLLDAIRQTNVVAGESGGITQHIGAYQVVEKGKKITFLDTPGHEAFKAMRSRGGQVADLAIIVVAADEGLKPQTMEVLDIVQKENLPFIMAINKIDKEGADLDRVKKELSELNIVPEDWGGKTICVPVSAKAKTNITELLDMVLLVADVESFKANSDQAGLGTIIESHIDRGEGPVATALVQNGTLRKGDFVVAGKIAGKIKAMKDHLGKEISEAGPSTPVKILGLKNIPDVGDVLEVLTDPKKIKEATRTNQNLRPKISETFQMGEESSGESEGESIDFNVILKTDVLGSQEAILEAFKKFKDPEIKLKVVKKGLGNITNADVLDAQTAQAIVLAFRVKTPAQVEELARDRKVEVLFYDIIYKLLEAIELRLTNILRPSVIRTELGKAKVLAIFRTGKNDMIVGCRVTEGKVKKNTKVKILRNSQLIGWGELLELQSGKEKVNESVQGEECGIQIKGVAGIQVNDLLEVYEEKTQARELGTL